MQQQPPQSVVVRPIRMHRQYPPPPQTFAIFEHILGGMILLLSVILLIYNSREMRSMSLYMILVVTLLFSLSVFVHGISQLFLEKEYGYFWPNQIIEPAKNLY